MGDNSETEDQKAGKACHDPEILGDLDVWNVRHRGDWLYFTADLKGEPFPRSYRRSFAGGDIISDVTGALVGIFSLGGARRGLGYDIGAQFPYHIVAPGDDLGAPGSAGTETESATTTCQRLLENTRNSLIADGILGYRKLAGRALPLHYVREHIDTSGDIRQLANGMAFQNLIESAKSLKLTAESLGKRARIGCIALDYCLEDAISSPEEYRAGAYELMDKLTAGLGELGFRKPVFLVQFDCGTRAKGDQSLLMAQWEMACQPAGHDLIFSAPGYMFEQDGFGRPTRKSVAEMAAMDVAALMTTEEGQKWSCPLFVLAQSQGDTVRVTATSLSELVIDADDPLAAGQSAGFQMQGIENGAELKSTAVWKKSGRDIDLKFDKAPQGKNMRVTYAHGANCSPDKLPANRGNVRDHWQHPSMNKTLRRWALPCNLPVN